jgi:hypothetical protein
MHGIVRRASHRLRGRSGASPPQPPPSLVAPRRGGAATRLHRVSVTAAACTHRSEAGPRQSGQYHFWLRSVCSQSCRLGSIRMRISLAGHVDPWHWSSASSTSPGSRRFFGSSTELARLQERDRVALGKMEKGRTQDHVDRGQKTLPAWTSCARCSHWARGARPAGAPGRIVNVSRRGGSRRR